MKSGFLDRTSKEEKWNAITHAAGFGVMLQTIFLATSVQAKLLASAITTTFLLSTMYHASEDVFLKRRLRLLDMASIHLTIGMTGTMWCYASRSQFWFVPIVFCSLSAIYTVRSYGTSAFERAMVPVSLLTVAISGLLFLYSAPTDRQLTFFFSGIVSYAIGVLFYLLDRNIWYHTIWHCFVLGGSLIHVWYFIL